ncbi:MAG: choice-of-anchor J domain-containing protein [Bacteroidetes bacterium]|nr:choice-of-anchor J domain-containing protein [Bacteroidota bacterium]
MQKTTTQKDFTVFLLRSFLLILISSIAFQVSFAQQQKAMSKPASARKGLPTDRSAIKVVPNNAVVAKKGFMAAVTVAEPSDVPSVNKVYTEKLEKNPGILNAQNGKAPSPVFNSPSPTPTPNGLNDVCTFTGSLLASDGAIPGGRLFRDGTLMSCGTTRGCPGTFGGGPYYYDSYTMTNNTCASQCVTVNYIADGTSGDCFVTVYDNSFDQSNVCTNYKADGGLSSLAGGTPVQFSFTLAANATVVIVVSEAVASTTCDHYTMTVTGINCTPPPACTPPTASVLSQVQIPGPPVNLINEQFDGTIVPAGWNFQNLSNPLGLTNWSQTNSLVFPPQSGAGFASANYNNTAGVGTISDWLFAPNITMKNGDKFTFWTRTTTGTFPDRLQVRRSTNGASLNVGTTESSVGDFTDLLLDINPGLTSTGYPTAWTQYTLTMSGLPAAGVSGRLAFRYYVTGGGPAGNNSDFIGIDNAVYSTPTYLDPTTCTGSTANLKVDITGGNSPTYKVVIGATPATAGFPMTVTGYVSGANIPVTPAFTTTYNLISVSNENNCTCVGTGNSGTPTITVSPTTVAGISITANPSTPLCAGDPTLLTVVGAPATGTATVNSGAIAVGIPDNNAAGVSTPLTVSGIPGTATGTSASVIFNITHTWDGDLTLFLKSPNNSSLNLVNQKGSTGDNFVNTVISSTATLAIPATGAPYTGTYTPDASLTAPAPTGFAPNVTSFTPMINTAGQLNGTWSFGARDNAGGDVGTITSWGITINYTSPAAPPVGYTYLWSPAAGLSNTTGNPVAASPASTTTYTVMGTAPNGCMTTGAITITVNQLPAVVTPPSNLTVCANSNATFSIVGSGAGITYQWQVSTNGGSTWTNVTNVAPYSGATSNTLLITGVPATFNTYRYRCVVSGTCPPTATSSAAILTVNALPSIVVTPGTPVCGGLAGVNGTLLTATGASTFTWAPATGLYSNATATVPYVLGTPTPTVYAAPGVNTVYTVTGTNGTTGCVNTTTVGVTFTPPAPTVTPSSVTMCLGNPPVKLTSSSSVSTSVTFPSGAISVPVPDNSLVGATSSINVTTIPANAFTSAMDVTFNMTHTWDGDIVMVLKAPNGNILNLDYYLSGTGGAGATTGFVNTKISSAGTAALNSGSSPYTGTFKPDAIVGNGPFGPSGPTGYLANVNNFPALYSTTNGTYTLAMYDGGAGDVGTLTSWTLGITYTVGVPTAGAQWSPAAGLFMDAAGAVPYVAGTETDTVYTKPAATTTYFVTVNSIGPDSTKTFSNTSPIAIIDGSPGSPYPATINVSGLPTSKAKVQNVVLNGISHTWSDDIDIVLQSPTGDNVILMSDVGGAAILSNVTYTFDDAGPAMNQNAGNPTGTYHPTNFDNADNWPAPGPGAFADANPALSKFNSNSNANGLWKLFVVDDTFGDQGNIAGGYSITFSYPTKGCTSPARQVPVTVNIPPSITNASLPADAVVCTDKVASFTAAAAGTAPVHNWQYSSNNGNIGSWVNITNGAVFSGAFTATLTVTAPPVSMNGWLIRDSVSGAAPCGYAITRIARLTVNPLPTIVIGASPVTRLFPGLTTTIFSTVSPIAATYTWLRNGVQVPNASGSSLLIDIDKLGDYSLRVTDVNGCTNTSNTVSIKDSVTGKVFIYPNPNSGQFQVRYWSIVNNTNLPRGINVYDATGKRVSTLKYSISAPYARMDVDLRNYGTGVYWIEVVDVVGNRLAMGRAEVLR